MGLCFYAFLIFLLTSNQSYIHGLQDQEQLQVLFPSVILEKVNFDITLSLNELKNGSVYPHYLTYTIVNGNEEILQNGTFSTVDEDGNYQSHVQYIVSPLKILALGRDTLQITIKDANETIIPQPIIGNTTNNSVATAIPTIEIPGFEPLITTHSIYVLPGVICILPPLVTLVLSAVLHQVLLALLVGIWCGATIVAQGNIIAGFLRTFDHYWVQSITHESHASVLLFTILLGGTIGVVQKGGGGHGLALLAKRFMTTSLRMQLSTWLICFLIFFDDYSSILIVGSSLRQVVSQTGVSNEKFAAIIHTVGVCLPSMAPVSSWIGVEIGYVAAQLHLLGLDSWDPFITCLSTLHYRFFPILFIGMIFITIICEKDFGPMVQFEKDAATSPITSARSVELTPMDARPCDSPPRALGPLEPDTSRPLQWYNAAVPFAAIVVFTFVGMILDGYDRLESTGVPRQSISLLDALSHCSSVAALIRASAGGWVIASGMLVLQEIITLEEATRAWIEGVKEILDPTIVLLLAWALGAVIDDVKLAAYVASLVGNSIDATVLPAIAAGLCFVVSFATGSAFGTMAILFPLISPLSWELSNGNTDNLLQCFGSILGSSVFGNCCSPIGDTSILTTLAVQIPLENHIRSILPYGVLVAVVSVLCGALPTGMNVVSPFTGFAIGLAVILFVVFFCGTKVHSRYRAMSSCSFLSVSPPSRYLPENEPLTQSNNSVSKDYV